MKVYLQDGYGYVEPLTGLKVGTLSSSTDGYELSGIYQGHFVIGDISLKGTYRNTSAAYFKKPLAQAEKRINYGKFYDDSYRAELYWRYQRPNNILSLQAAYFNELGKDYNFTLAGNNYLYALEELSIHPLWSHLNDKRQTQYELGIKVRLTDQEKLDGIASQRMEYQYVHTAISGAYYFRFRQNNSMLKAALQAGIQHPLHADVSIPSQSYNFTTGVVFRDYYYYNVPVSSGVATLLYQLPIQKINTFVQLQSSYTQAGSWSIDPAIQPSAYPGKHRWIWQCSVGLTL
jgi:hypothetical protein